MPAAATSPALRLLERAVNLKTGEAGAATVAALYNFALLCGYFVMRPIRDSMGIAGGVDQIPWLFLGTFLTMLAAVPLFGLLTAKLRRAVFLPWVYVFFMLNIVFFAVTMELSPGDARLARAFFIWVSVFNLFIVSVFWSFMVDLFSREQSRRLFGFLAAGGTAGALTGPLITGLFAERVGQFWLLMTSVTLLGIALLCIRYLLAWSMNSAASRLVNGAPEERERSTRPLGGNPFAGISLVISSRYLGGIAIFILLLTSVSTFLYIEQLKIVETVFESRDARTAFFGKLDAVVQALTITIQLFITSRLASRFGVMMLLVSVPVLMTAGFLTLSVAPIFPVLVGVLVIRRALEYSITRPAREMLFTSVDTETKYKAKNFIDTVVYRGGDWLASMVHKLLVALGTGLGGIALFGAGVAAIWAGVAYALGRAHERSRESGNTD